MPVAKRKPHIVELIDLAVKQNQKLVESRDDMLAKPPQVWEAVDNQMENFFFKAMPATLHNRIIFFSRKCEKLAHKKIFTLIRVLIWPLAMACMAHEAQHFGVKEEDKVGIFVYVADQIISAWFLLDSVMKLSGNYIRIEIEHAYGRSMTPTTIFVQSGLLEFIVSLICFGRSSFSSFGGWIRIVRLISITFSFLTLIPQIDVLMTCISNGLRSVLSTIALLVLLIVVYASFAHKFFARNDPRNFGTFGLSVLTFSILTMFDGWAEVYKINYSGCDAFPSHYTHHLEEGGSEPHLGEGGSEPHLGEGGSEPHLMAFDSLSLDAYPVHYTDPPAGAVEVSESFSTAFGYFTLEPCSHPHAQPVLSTLVFVSFELLAAYIIIAMCLAAVAIGISERLESFRSLKVYVHEDEDDRVSISSMGGMSKKAIKMMGSNGEEKMLLKMLREIFKGKDVAEVIEGSNQFETKLFSNISVKSLTNDASKTVKSRSYEILVSLWIFGEAILQIYDDSQYDGVFNPTSFCFHVVFEAGFIVDALIKCAVHLKDMKGLAKDFWGLHDVLLTLVLLVPLCAPDDHRLAFLGMLRLLRMGRILKSLSSYTIDLQVILMSVSNSFRCLLYVLFLMVIFFFHAGIVAVVMFKGSSPYYFGDVGKAMQSLFNVMTLDKWIHIMFNNMYGCKHDGFHTGVHKYDSQCDSDGRGMGWWSPIFFIPFVIFSAHVLASTFVGVIIESMELLREGINEEKEIWAKVEIMKTKYGIDEPTTQLFLKMFEVLDKEATGGLSFEAVCPIFNLVDMTEKEQFDTFLQMDKDKNLILDFAEFCEMVSLIVIAHRQEMGDDFDFVCKPRRRRSSFFMSAKAKKVASLVTNFCRRLGGQEDCDEAPDSPGGGGREGGGGSASVLDFRRRRIDHSIDEIEKTVKGRRKRSESVRTELSKAKWARKFSQTIVPNKKVEKPTMDYEEKEKVAKENKQFTKLVRHDIRRYSTLMQSVEAMQMVGAGPEASPGTKRRKGGLINDRDVLNLLVPEKRTVAPFKARRVSKLLSNGVVPDDSSQRRKSVVASNTCENEPLTSQITMPSITEDMSAAEDNSYSDTDSEKDAKQGRDADTHASRVHGDIPLFTAEARPSCDPERKASFDAMSQPTSEATYLRRSSEKDAAERAKVRPLEALASTNSSGGGGGGRVPRPSEIALSIKIGDEEECFSSSSSALSEDGAEESDDDDQHMTNGKSA